MARIYNAVVENLPLKKGLNSGNTFLKSYIIAYYCNLDSGTAEILRIRDDSQNDLVGRKLSFDESVVRYIDRLVHPDDRERVLSCFNREFIKKALKEAEEFTFNFTDAPESRTYRCTIIRGDDDHHVGIVALSANAFAEDKAASIASGMNDHVAKPINVDELKKVIAKFI